MIFEIYILDEFKNVIYGDESLINSALKSNFPTSHIREDLWFTLLKCDEIFLGSLYSGLNPLHVLQVLKIISKQLPFRPNAAKIKSKYFDIFEILNKCCISNIFLSKPESNQIIPVEIFKKTNILQIRKKNEVFIDVVESFYLVSDTAKKIIYSTVIGEIIYKTLIEKPINIKLSVKKTSNSKIEFQSNNKLSSQGITTDLEFSTICGEENLVSRYICHDADPPILMKGISGGYELCVKQPVDKIKIYIPIARTAYKVDFDVKLGSASYLEKHSMVIWAMNCREPTKTNIILKTKQLEEESSERPIKIEFSKVGNSPNIIVKSVKSGLSNTETYVKYYLKNQKYEIRNKA